MLKKTITLLIAVHFIITACGHSSDNSSTGSSQLSTTAPAINSNGEIVTTVNSTSGAKIAASSLQSSSNDPLSQLTSVEIPAGALSNAADIKIFETPSLAQNVTAASFGLTTISKAGPSIAIQSSATLSQPITVSVPYSLDGAKLLLAGQNLAVLVLSGSTVDLMTGDQINIGLNTVDVKVSKFGAFQVINYTGSVMQTTATSQISDSSLQSTTTVAAAAAAPAVTPTPTPTPAAPAPTATPTPVVSILEGKWLTYNNGVACYEDSVQKTGTIYAKTYIEVVGSIYKMIGSYHSSSDCSTASLLYTDVMTLTYVLGTANSIGSPIDLIPTSWTITPTNEAGITLLKVQNPEVAATSWVVNTSLQMTLNNTTHHYGICKVTDNKWIFGGNDDNDGKTPATRIQTLSTTDYALKVN